MAWHLNDILTIILLIVQNELQSSALGWPFSFLTHNPSSPKVLISGKLDDSQGVRLTDIHHRSAGTDKQIHPHWVCLSPLLSCNRVEMWWSTHLEKWHGHVVTLHSWRLSYWASQCEKSTTMECNVEGDQVKWFKTMNKRTTVITLLIR